MTSQTAIIIPVYKDNLTENESISFHRTIFILSNYPIVIAAPSDLDLHCFVNIAQQYGKQLQIERYQKDFFNGLNGYNRMLLSQEFYERFRLFEYILICQLDSYIFYNKLNDWCSREFDYIGAPLIIESNGQFNSDNMRVGNGGFSLRRIKPILNFFSSRQNVFSSKQIIKLIDLWKKPYTRIFVWLLMMLGWRNKPTIVSSKWQYNEDDFWSGLLDNSRFALKKPIPEEALKFSFERFPLKCYQHTNALPFGCHAWEKYDYELFWRKFIK
jgi:hypothetical protein